MKTTPKLLTFILAIFLFCGCREKTLRIIFPDGYAVRAELALTDNQRAKGLMYRQSLSENQAMLFIFSQEDRLGFWMKNMNFPLDIIWLDKQQKIVDIQRNATPCQKDCLTLLPKEKAIFVLEVVSGFSDKHKLANGASLKSAKNMLYLM